MTIKIGFEVEFFVEEMVGGEIVLPSIAGLSSNMCDECGWLAEARSNPFEDIYFTSFDLTRNVDKMKKYLKSEYKLSHLTTVRLPHKLLWKAVRQFGKHSADDECMYGEIKERKDQTAGFHIHFSNSTEVYRNSNKEYVYGSLNIPYIIKFFDKAFKEEIKCSKRQPGCYEMKPWGFEYRSLPNTVFAQLGKVEHVCIDLLKESIT